MPKAKKQISEADAWRLLAIEHDKGKTDEFLCIALQDSWAERHIPSEIRAAMKERIDDSLGHDGPAYDEMEIFADGADVRPARVLACLMFAEQSADDDQQAAEEHEAGGE